MALTQVDQSMLGTNAQYTGFKSRIINGAMVIDQRNAGASITVAAGGSGYGVDRFYCENFQSGTMTVQQSSTAPAGFLNSVVHTVTVTDTPASGDYLFESTSIEGLNMADLGWGTANAQTVTFSFWVRSSITGTYGIGLRNSAGNRSYVATYTVNASNTWEQKTITVAGDTSGTWLTTNGLGVRIFWDLGSGSNFNGTANSWNAGSYWRTSGCLNWISNSGATFYITGVQLEKGSTATSFDSREYGDELRRCQRYYWKSLANNNVNQLCWASLTNQNSSTRLYGFFQYPTTMRTTPSSISINSLSVALYYGSSGTNITAASIDGSTIGQNTAAIIFDTATSPATAGQVLILTSQGGGAGYVAFSSEL